MFMIIERADGGISVGDIGDFDPQQEYGKWLESATVHDQQLKPEEQDKKWLPAVMTAVHELKIPQSRNYRDAWKKEGTEISIDLEKAKPIQKALILMKAQERVEKDAIGRQDLSQVDEQILSLDIDNADSLTALYNKWPQCIDKRNEYREYEVFINI